MVRNQIGTRLLVASVVGLVLAVQGAFAGQSKDAKTKGETADQSVIPVFELKGVITETPVPDDLLRAWTPAESLHQLLTRLRRAVRDKKVRALVLLWDGAEIGSGQIEEIRAVLEKAKQAGKPVWAHATSLTTRSYVLLSGASRLSVVPTGDVWVTGIYAESPYARALLDKIGVVPDYMTCGAYKSAAEIFMRNGPSPEAEEMLNWLADSQFETYLKLISQGRGVPVERVRQWIDKGIFSAESAVRAGLVDAAEFREDFVAKLKKEFGEDIVLQKRYGRKKPYSVDLSTPLGLLTLWAQLLEGPSHETTADQVALVYVDGPILPGSGDGAWLPLSNIAYSDRIRRALDRVAEDKQVKAVVMRINSPGGSAVASEEILHAARRVAAKKPLVVSMGDVAGSGGYYVACGGQTIFADATTLTGSIGVVAGKFVTTGLWEKLGIHWHAVRRGKRAAILSSAAVFSEEEREALRKWMDEIYDTFKRRVVEARGKRLKKPIDQLAGGRVFTGRQAVELGLVDRLGGLDEAIVYAADKAGVKRFAVQVVPRPKGFLETLLEGLTGEQSEDEPLLTTPVLGGSDVPSVVRRVWPLLHGLDRQRTRAILSALQRMDWLQRTHVGLFMPEVVFSEQP